LKFQRGDQGIGIRESRRAAITGYAFAAACAAARRTIIPRAWSVSPRSKGLSRLIEPQHGVDQPADRPQTRVFRFYARLPPATVTSVPPRRGAVLQRRGRELPFRFRPRKHVHPGRLPTPAAAAELLRRSAVQACPWGAPSNHFPGSPSRYHREESICLCRSGRSIATARLPLALFKLSLLRGVAGSLVRAISIFLRLRLC